MSIFKSKKFEEQALFIYLNNSGLDASAYERDRYTLDDLLDESLGDRGFVDLTENAIALYGFDAEEMLSLVRPVLSSNSVCQGARIVLRSGGPGTSEREIVL